MPLLRKECRPLEHKKDCEEWIALSSQFPYLLERMKGVEPSCPAWEAGVLPMNYTRISYFIMISYPARFCQ